MTPWLYEASVPVFQRYLERLRGLIRAAKAHADTHRIAAPELLGSRLADSMHPFASQVAIAAGFTLRACFPLAGQEIPPSPEFPATFAGLEARVAHAAALLDTLRPAQFEHGEERVLHSQAGSALVSLPAPEFLFQYALPNFFFHLTSAYAILRKIGLPLGKEHFDGFHRYPA